MRLVMIDNYDSFTYNLVQLFREFDLEVIVFRNDAATAERIEKLEPDWICISPGPRSPAHAGVSKSVVQTFGPTVPILGVCLGMQVINEVFGGVTRKAPVPVHGKQCLVRHGGRSIFSGIPSPFRTARYHSLCIEPRGDHLEPVAHADDGVIMGISHARWPLRGVQFHPESFMTQFGLELVANFLSLNHAWTGTAQAVEGPGDRFPRFSGGQFTGTDPSSGERI